MKNRWFIPSIRGRAVGWKNGGGTRQNNLIRYSRWPLGVCKWGAFIGRCERQRKGSGYRNRVGFIAGSTCTTQNESFRQLTNEQLTQLIKLYCTSQIRCRRHVFHQTAVLCSFILQPFFTSPLNPSFTHFFAKLTKILIYLRIRELSNYFTKKMWNKNSD